MYLEIFMLPKIIHQFAPADTSKWDPKWKICQTSWFRALKASRTTYEYRMWTDENLDAFVRKRYPHLHEIYCQYPYHIMRIDFARYLVLFTFGGLYADMDYEIVAESVDDVFDVLSEVNVSLVESPWKQNETCQNSLMASPEGHPFWNYVVQEAIRHSKNPSILDATGPRLLDRCYQMVPFHANLLPVSEFNPSDEDSDAFHASIVKTRHHRTMIWYKKNGSALGY
jgi:mannosyltransferase OCH1-like enzyme